MKKITGIDMTTDLWGLGCLLLWDCLSAKIKNKKFNVYA